MSKHLLKINASVNTTDSASRQLAGYYESRMIDKYPNLKITHRDLSMGMTPINEDWINASSIPEEKRDQYQQKILALSDHLINELVDADEIVLATPMYNFSVPGNLKIWIDQIARAGKTFQYTAEGPRGLLRDKPVKIIITTGGTPVGSEIDYLSAYLKQIFNFIGITDVSLIAADQLMMDRDNSLKQAKTQIHQLFSNRQQAA